jgi:ubiquinone/menaquinone biosynthesis C-methylase UbiE
LSLARIHVSVIAEVTGSTIKSPPLSSITLATGVRIAMTPSYKNSFSGKGVFPPRYAFTLLIPFRNIFLSPNQLLRRLDLREDHVVLEIGPGPGYFSTHVAQRLSKGRLVLLDIQQEMLDYAKKRLDKKKIANVDYRLTDGHSLDLESNCFDRIFMVTVLGEVDDKDSYLKDIYRILKEDGVLSISELAGDPDKLELDEIQSLVSAYGFEVKEVFGSRLNFTVNFAKTKTPLSN